MYGKDFESFFYNQNDFIKILKNSRQFRHSYICITNSMFDLFAIYPFQQIFEKFDCIINNEKLIFATTYVSYDSKDLDIYSKKFIESKFHHIKNIIKRKELIKLELKRHYKVYFIDSLSHLKNSVEQLGSIVKIQKLPKPKFLGQIPKNFFEMEELKKYNINDSKITFSFMNWLQNEYIKLGCEMKSTISATALDLFRRKFLKQFLMLENREKIKFAYNAYYGGRTEVFQRGRFTKENFGIVKCYDVNSLYPYIMKTGIFPYPKSFFKQKVLLNDIKSFEGVCYTELFCPEMLIPFLPVRIKKKLMFPTGLIKGHYSFIELRFALTLGYKILKIGEGLIYKNVFNPFKNFVSELYDYRLKRKAVGDSSELVPKILLNSIYGKFGYKFFDRDDIVDGNLISREEMDKYMDGSIFYPFPYCSLIRVSRSDDYIPNYCFPIWSLYVTSQARIHLYKLMKEIGFKNVLYCDTDSIFTRRNVFTNSEIGGLKLENSFSDCIFAIPKVYGGITENDEEYIKIKGLKGGIKEYKEFVSCCDNGILQKKIMHFRKFRGAVHANTYVNEIYFQKKIIEFDDLKRAWSGRFTLKIQNSKPFKFSEIDYKNEKV